MEDSLSLGFNPRDAFTYPKAFFDASVFARVEFSILHGNLAFIESLPAYQSDVFQGVDTILPNLSSILN